MRFARSRPTVVTCMADGSSLWRHTTTTTLGTRCRSAGAVHPINSRSGGQRAPANDMKAIEGGNGWRILSVVISGAISPPKLSLQAPRNVPYGLPRFAGCFAPWSDAVPRYVMDLFGGNRLLVSQAFDGSDDAEAVAKAKVM